MPRAKKASPELLARSITLVDDAGHMRAFLGASNDGNAYLSLYGSDRACFTACIDRDGNPKLCFENKKGYVVMALGVADDMGQGIQVNDSQGRPVCHIFTPDDGIPRIRLLKSTSPTELKKFWGTPLPKKKKRT